MAAEDEKPTPVKLGTMRGTVQYIDDIVSTVFDEWEHLDPNDDKSR